MFIGFLFVALFIFSLVMTYYHKWLTTRDAYDIPPLWAKDVALLSFEMVRITMKYVSLVAIVYNYGWLYGVGGYAVSEMVGRLAYKYHFKNKVLALTEEWVKATMKMNPLKDPFQAHMDAHIAAYSFVSDIKYPGHLPVRVSQTTTNMSK